MKIVRIILVFLIMLIGLFSCENFNVKRNQSPHSWGGSISFIMSNFSSVALASDGICLSTCTSTKCANLIVHRDSNNHETVCSTNATTSYEFKFKEDPNTFYEGLLIEIQIEDSLNASNNRSKIEIVSSDSGKVKNIDLGGTIVATAIKEKLLVDLDEDVADIQSAFDSYKELITIDSLDAALALLYGTGLLSDLSDEANVTAAVAVIQNLQPSFLVEMVSKVKESNEESAAYTSLSDLCSASYTKLHPTTQTIVGQPYCYLSLASIANGTPEAWNPASEIPSGYTINYDNFTYYSMAFRVPVTSFPEAPADLSSYILASDYLAQNFTTNSCYLSGIRFGGSVSQDYTLKTVSGTFFDSRTQSPPLIRVIGGPSSYAPIDMTYNTYLIAKVYSACVVDPLYKSYCSAITDDPGIHAMLSSMAQEGFCYF